MSELRECPCGRPAVISAADIAGRRSAHCDDQDCYWSIVGFSDEQVTERWNRRPDPAPAGVRCETCGGSGQITGMTRTGEDSYREEHFDCPVCDAAGIASAYVQQHIARLNDTIKSQLGLIRHLRDNPQPGAVVDDVSGVIGDMVRVVGEHPDYGSLMMYVQGWLYQLQNASRSARMDKNNPALVERYGADYMDGWNDRDDLRTLTNTDKGSAG